MSVDEQREQRYRREVIQRVRPLMLENAATTDPQYPYYGAWEADRLAGREADEPDRIAEYNARMEREDTFDPDVNVRLYVSLSKNAPIGSGEGAIYSLEYLRKPRRSPWRR